MLELKGKYNSAKVFTDVIGESAVAQIIELCCQPMSEGAQIRIMPDVHAGKGCTVGTTMTIKDKVVANLVGVDIGCGMETVMLKEKHIEPQKLDKVIRECIPAGFETRKKPHRFNEKIDLTALYCYKEINPLYRIRVFDHRDVDTGKQVFRNLSVKCDSTKSESWNRKNAKKQAAIFEKSVEEQTTIASSSALNYRIYLNKLKPIIGHTSSNG